MDRLKEISNRLEAAKSPLGAVWDVDDDPELLLIKHAPDDIRFLLSEVERLRAIETNVKGIIPFLERHLHESREITQDNPTVKMAFEIGYLDCLGTLKDALFEASLASAPKE